MKILIKQARIIDPQSPFNGHTADILITDGQVTDIGQINPDASTEIIDIPGIHVSPGWMDIFANFGDPGYEFKETLESGAASAAAGGYTDVMIIPNTNPVSHNKSSVEYLLSKSSRLPVTIHPIGAVTRGAEGKELAEMYDMRASGARAFSDGTQSIQSSGLLLKALQYVKPFNGTIIQLPDDRSINPQGLMNEGIASTQLGVPGKPAIAEEVAIARDITLAAYTESSLHFTGISTRESVRLIREAKKQGIRITCSVTPYHLFFIDEDLATYDTNLKVNPPLRTADDRDALREALLDGTIDCIATHHLPHDYDNKVSEFEYAKFGMIGLETAWAVVHTAVPALSAAQLVKLLTAPREIFDLESVIVQKGATASLTLFDPAQTWKVATTDIRSRSSNSPFIGRELKGRVIGIFHNGKLTIN